MRWYVVIALACLVAGCGSDEAYSVGDEDVMNVETDESAIIGGTTGGDGCVIELYIRAPGRSPSICSCTVVDRRTCLTAAHCVDPRVVGQGATHEVLWDIQPFPSTGRMASRTAFDPRFNPSRLQDGYDFGVVQLSGSFPTAICAFGAVIPGLPVRLVGYGSNTHTNTGSGTRRQVTVSISQMSSLFFRAGDSNAQSCHGDSGGPALQNQLGSGAVVVGVTSFGDDRPPQVCFDGAFHARVDSAMDWIAQNVVCGNGVCQPEIGETPLNCNADCHSCGDTICGVGENVNNCYTDCSCGDGVCVPPENGWNCGDCPPPCLSDDPTLCLSGDPRIED